MLKEEFLKSIGEMKVQVIDQLKEMDLTDSLIYVRDEVSGFTGYSIDHEIGSICTKLTITGHEGTTICLEDDFGDDLGEFELENFGLELLLTLL